MYNKEQDANYGPMEDVAASISVRTARADTDAIKPKGFLLSGPACVGCRNHNKAIMLTYYENDIQLICDLFLNAENAKNFLADIEQFYSAGDSLVIIFENAINGMRKKFLIEGNHLDDLLKRLDADRDDINSYIDANIAFANQEPIPARRPPPTDAEIEATRKPGIDYHVHEPRDVSLIGIDMGLLLAALYNNAKTGGMGSRHYRDELMTPAEGQHIWRELSRIGALHAIDYINGRSIKCSFGQDEEGQNTLRFTRYHDYNGISSTTIILLARRGVYGTLTGQGGLDTRNEAAILLGTLLDEKELPETDVKRLADKLQKQQVFYMEARRPTSEPIFYQISICGNGPVRGEVGPLIAPFTKGQIPPTTIPPAPG